ncbi:hypothetical protein ACERK3_07400 [Phycisphaerales bacterium AB-hyl4]|uniref:DoxX-like protein n=1 Tax=Natronomicrosphaera hydrolytica TaxID=3242702 RepID=A0ABV4U5J3_9BACT
MSSTLASSTPDAGISHGVLDDARAARRLAWASWLLRLALLGYAVGVLGQVWQQMGTLTGSYLFMHHGIPHATVATWERGVSVVLAVVIVAAVVRPHVLLLLPVAAVVMTEAVCGYVFGGYHFSEWTVAAHVMRYVAPLVLAMLVVAPGLRWWSARRRSMAAAWGLRLGLACLFATHGLEAYRLHPGFVDLIIGSADNVLGVRVSESQAGVMLRVIGVIDLMVAAAVLVLPMRYVLWWLAFWGLVTALSRTTALGLGHWHEVLLRSSHVLGPLALWQVMVAVRLYRRPAHERASEAVVQGAGAAEGEAA